MRSAGERCLIQDSHRDFTLHDYQRVASATAHFEDAIAMLADQNYHRSGMSQTNYFMIDRNWVDNPRLRVLRRPEVFNTINATSSFTDLANSITPPGTGPQGYLLRLTEADDIRPRFMEFDFWPDFSDLDDGARKIKWVVAFVIAATKVSMSNSQRFPPSLQGLKSFMHTSICGGAGVAPSPGTATWWSEVVSLWDR